MKILAIDPGYERLGIAVLEKTSGRETLLYSDCFQTPKKLELAERLLLLGTELERVIKEFKPDTLAIEKLFFSINQKTAIAVAETKGAIKYLSAKHGLKVYEYSPQAVKLAVCGYGNADKKQVMLMTEKLIACDGKKRLDDEWDAIAIGLTHLSQTPSS